MRPNTIKKFERRLWGKIAIYAIFMSVYFYIMGLLMPWYDYNPIWLSLIALLVCLSMPLLIKVNAPSERNTTKEYEKINQDFEELGNQLILQTFGSKDLEILYMEEGNWRPTCAIDVCRNLIQKEHTKNDPELRFHLFVNMAKYCERLAIERSHSLSSKCIFYQTDKSYSEFQACYSL